MRQNDDFVAQLVEQLTLNQWAEGSSPSEVTENKEVVQLRQFLNNMERDSIKWISFSFVLLLFSS